MVRSTSNTIDVAVQASGKIRMDINTIYFPGWEVLVDGQKSPFKYAGEGGIMRVDVPAGIHFVQARYVETRLAQVADVVSVILIVSVGVIWYSRGKALTGAGF